MWKITGDVLADHVRVFAAEAVADGAAPVVSNQNTFFATKCLEKNWTFTLRNKGLLGYLKLTLLSL